MTWFLPLLATGPEPGAGDFWMPEAASSEAGRTDALFNSILYLSIVFFVLVVGAMLIFVIKYRRRGEPRQTAGIHGNLKLQVAWGVIPAIGLLFVFTRGFGAFISGAVPPGDAIDVQVTAKKWSWTFGYPNDGIDTNNLVVPVGRPVKLTLSSADVTHSFYVPAFRIKRDVLPKRDTVAWFQADKKGEYPILCAEYCGARHSHMVARVIVKSEKGYMDWIDSGGGLLGKGMSSADFGKLLFKQKGCTACHSVDGSKLTGPTLLGKYGTREPMADGTTALVDDDYLRQSITDPNARVVKGFSAVMPTFAGRLKEKQLSAIIDYIKSLGPAK